ncbi:MAG: sodium:solute symporter family protein [Planctomycetota bacterium]|jgi:SSS family solute:Na+ symporter
MQIANFVNYAVIIGYLGLVVFLGLHFSKRQKDTDRYYKGGRQIPSWAVGMSILATLISSITFLAYPGAGYLGNWVLLVQGLMVPLVLVALIWVIVPMYRKVIGLSAYEYFEKRFGFFGRLYSSIAFFFAHFTKMGTVFFLLAVALTTLIGLDKVPYGTYWVILALGILVIIYTLLGGIEAVVWCDVVQGFMLVGGGLICVAVLFFTPEGGPAAVVSKAWENGKIDLAPYNFAWDMKLKCFFVLAINGIFYAVQKYGTDQTIVQRFLLSKTDKGAIKAALMGACLCVPVWTLFMFIGSCLWAFYDTSTAPVLTSLSVEQALPAGVTGDKVFPYFIIHQLPMGLTGLIIAALCAAALSSLDSDLNCLSAIGVEDYYKRARPNSTDQQKLKVGRIIVAVCGIFAMLIACAYVKMGGKAVLGTVFSLYAIFSGGIAGLFILAFFTKRTNKQGLYVGIVVCVLFTAYAVLTSTKFDLGLKDAEGKVIKELILDMGRLNFTHDKYMLQVYSNVVLFGVGYLASFLFKSDKDITGLTFYDWRNRKHREEAEAAQQAENA